MSKEILDVVFGIDHVIAEFFWNGLFIFATYLITKSKALRGVHKYIDDKHGVTHKENEY